MALRLFLCLPEANGYRFPPDFARLTALHLPAFVAFRIIDAFVAQTISPMTILRRDMTDSQFKLAVEFLGTLDDSTGLLLDGLNSQGGLDYCPPVMTGITSCDPRGEWRYACGLVVRDHTAVKEAFSHLSR